MLEGEPLNLNWTHGEIKRQADVLPSILYGLELEVTVCKTLHLKCMGSVGGQPIFKTDLYLVQKMHAGKVLRRT